MRLLLDLFYAAGLLLASPWIAYRLTRTHGWSSVPARLGIGIEPRQRPVIWLHGSSVGEVALLEPLVEMLEREYAGASIVITAYTNTGLDAARRRYPRHRVLPFPLDFTFVVDRLLQRLEPRAIVIVESDFWPNFLNAARRRDIPIAVVNGKLSEKSSRAHRRLAVVARNLQALDCVAVQTDEHARRFVELGVPPERVHVTGNMKYDLARADLDNDTRGRYRALLGLGADTVVLIGASLHRREDVVLLECFAGIRDQLQHSALLIVPRYPDQGAEVARHAASAGFNVALKTNIDRGTAGPPGEGGVVVVDTLGELRRLYAAADVAFVGGSLYYRGANKGGHNLMEPAILGLPVVFGPYNFSFKETVTELVGSDAGFLVHDAGELERALRSLLTDADLRQAVGARARDVIHRNQGATERNMRLLEPILRRAGMLAAFVATEDNAPGTH